MPTITCPHCDELHAVSDAVFSKAVGKAVKCRTCKESFQVQPPETQAAGGPVDVQLLPSVAEPVSREPIKAPDRTAAFHSVLAMRSQPYVNIIASCLVMIGGCMNSFKNAHDPHYEKGGYIFGIGVLMLIVSWLVNAHLRRQAATLEIQMNIERLLVTIANNTVRDDAQRASESAITADGKAT